MPQDNRLELDVLVTSSALILVMNFSLGRDGQHEERMSSFGNKGRDHQLEIKSSEVLIGHLHSEAGLETGNLQHCSSSM